MQARGVMNCQTMHSGMVWHNVTDNFRLIAEGGYTEKTWYLADTDQMKSTLQTLLSETVILLAHNPGITELAHNLMNHEEKHENFMDFPAASTLVIDFKADRWSEVKSNSGIFVDFVMPLQL